MSVASLLAAPSSIDVIGLPQAPATRYDLEEVEEVNPEAEVWYRLRHWYEKGGDEVLHGLWIERRRSRDRERYNTDYVEVRRMYYDGERSAHSVVSTWVGGMLRKREYRLSDELDITVEFNSRGEPMQGPRSNARGGRAKRERITDIFDNIYELNPR